MSEQKALEEAWQAMFRFCSCPGEEFGTCDHALAIVAEARQPYVSAIERALAYLDGDTGAAAVSMARQHLRRALSSSPVPEAER